MGRVFLLVPLRSTSSILYSMALKISQVSSKWRDDYGLFSGTIVLTVHQFIYPINDRNFSMDATLVVYANGDNKSIHGRGRSWSAERGRCKRSSMIHYGARPEWTEWNIYIYEIWRPPSLLTTPRWHVELASYVECVGDNCTSNPFNLTWVLIGCVLELLCVPRLRK